MENNPQPHSNDTSLQELTERSERVHEKARTTSELLQFMLQLANTNLVSIREDLNEIHILQQRLENIGGQTAPMDSKAE